MKEYKGKSECNARHGCAVTVLPLTITHPNEQAQLGLFGSVGTYFPSGFNFRTGAGASQSN